MSRLRILSSCIVFIFFAYSLVQAETALRYANNFEITEHGTHRILTIRNTHQKAESTIRYALVPKDQALPKLADNLTVIRTPVERVVVMETVYIGYLEALQKIDTIVGAGTIDFISNSDVQARINAGQIRSVQIGQGLDIERMLLLQPDLILTSISGDPTFDVPAKLTRSGLPVVLSAGYMEAHPLARAEWIKFIAAFFEADAQATELFDAMANRYERLKAKITPELEHPTVFAGAPYSGAWYVAGGESYMARAIDDAGGDYLWADTPRQGAIALDTERVFLRAAQADIWLDPSHYRTRDELFAADQRFTKFHAAKVGSVFNNTKQVSSNGGNAIWETGIVHPDKVLADLIAIFHPELMPDHTFVFYEQLK
ncbi:MAG: ABC transporter substrate-binding protein [Opitutales bacterium]|nr:ABC transporter substrate-binding protein [Opitutales bacterium]